ncbi:hypothetical protein D5086_029206 [Populus alba]|uniref:Uncharacterized protein n=1 Tax=Populus alba TaxID=43335 RepID=A0ACC4ATP5_POPAL
MASESQQHNKGESQPSESTLFPSGRLKSPGAGYTPPLSYPPTLGYAPPGPYPAYQPPGCYPYARAPPPAYYINATISSISACLMYERTGAPLSEMSSLNKDLKLCQPLPAAVEDSLLILRLPGDFLIQDVGVAHSSSHGSKNCEPPPFATSKDAAGVELEHALIKFTSVTW